MAIRTTQSAVAASFLAHTQAVYSRMEKVQQQIQTGVRISNPSDDPFGTSQVLDYDRELADVKRYQENVASSLDMMTAADTAMGSMTDAMKQIRTLTLQAMNGTNSPADMLNIGRQISELKESVRDGANAQYGGQYIFGGTNTLTQPYPAGANTYAGTPNQITRRIGLNQTAAVNLPGPTLMGVDGPPAPGNVLDVIDQLVADINANNTGALQANLNQIDVASERIIAARTQVGSLAARLETTRDRLASTEERLMTARTEVIDVDPTEAFVQFNQTQTAYQAALASGMRMMQTTILDFI